jgi:cysteine-rich repeat protein
MFKRSSVIAASLFCSFSLIAPAFAAVTPAQKCASSKMKAAGKRLNAQAKCYSKALAASAVVDPACLQSAATKFADAFTKAETGDCLHDADAGTIGVKIDAVIDDIAGDVGCGDGAEQGDETCDDGNAIEGDGCSSTCTGPTCGDGMLSGAEGCDDGAVAVGDGCSDTCSVEAGYECAGEPSVCTPLCGAENSACGTGGDCCSDNCVSSLCGPPCGGLASACATDADCCLSMCVTGFCLEP